MDKKFWTRVLMGFAVLFLAAFSGGVGADESALTAEEILAKVDANEVADSVVMTFKMVINRGERRRPKTLEMRAWIEGREKAAMEVISGPDRGTRYLKLGDDLWIASREAERPMKISGHMLRQAMLDSDWSYEDTTENQPLAERFSAEIVGEEEVEGYQCWKLSLSAKGSDETYPYQTLWVDQKTFLPVRQELKALSGMLLKVLVYEDLRQVQGRWTPMKMTMTDQLRRNTSTTVEVQEIQFEVPIDPRILSLEFVEHVR